MIEDGDVGSVGSVDQGRGSQEGDTVGGGGGDVGEDREIWSDGCQYFDEEVSGGPARPLRASRHDMGCLEVSGGPAQLLRASRHDMGCLEVSGGH